MTRHAWVLAVLLVSGCRNMRDVTGIRDYTVDPTIIYEEVKFKDVVANPGAYKSMHVEFDALFYRHDETVWNHFYTPFIPEDYKSFSAWVPEARIWEVDGWVSSVPTLYMRKQLKYMPELLEATPYALVRLSGTVVTDYENRPWIDVHRVSIRDREVFTEASLRMMIAGMTDAHERRPAPARERLEQALKGKLSPEARYLTHMKLGQLYEDANDFVKAMQHFTAALSLKANDPAAREGYERNFKFEERRKQIEAQREEEERKAREKKKDEPKKQP